MGVGFVYIGHLPVVDVIGVCVDKNTDDSERGGVYTLHKMKEELSQRKVSVNKTAYSINSRSSK